MVAFGPKATLATVLTDFAILRLGFAVTTGMLTADAPDVTGFPLYVPLAVAELEMKASVGCVNARNEVAMTGAKIHVRAIDLIFEFCTFDFVCIIFSPDKIELNAGEYPNR